MEPSTGPAITPREQTTCLDCGDPIPAGRRYRCDLCVQAAEQAIREAGGRTVLPSDVARVRARLAEGAS